jgi:oxygen-independent coproporphyrinogen-3 oxidase
MFITSLLRVILTHSLRPFEFKNTYSNTLNFENEKELGLYVHIPFCRKLCSFCPYCKVTYNKDLADRYKIALQKEIKLVSSILKNEKKHVTSLYFGGGTPALMINDIKDIINTINEYFIIDGGIGVELHPDDVNTKNLEILKNSGVTMISLGVQSFNENCLKKLGRNKIDSEERVKLISSFNFDVLDVDLIFAIPEQTKEILFKDIKTAFDAGATQISTYPFIDFTFADNEYKPLSEKYKKEMLFEIAKYCKNNNYMRTSVWTFAKQNTQKYSSVTRDNFLGFGVSATTLLRDIFKINTFNIESYINRISENNIPTSLTLNFTFRQRLVYYLFWSAYAMKIDPEKFKSYFGVSLEKLYGFEFWIGKKLGLIKQNKNIYELTDKGAYYYHFIEQTYTTAYIDKMWNVSRNIDFPKEIKLY